MAARAGTTLEWVPESEALAILRSLGPTHFPELGTALAAAGIPGFEDTSTVPDHPTATCPACGSAKVAAIEIQTRRGDEAGTPFLKCDACRIQSPWRGPA